MQDNFHVAYNNLRSKIFKWYSINISEKRNIFTLCSSVKRIFEMKTFVILYILSAFNLRANDVAGEFARIQNNLFPTLTGLAATQTEGSAVF